MATATETPTVEANNDESSGMSVTRMVMLGAGGLIVFVLLFLVFGLVISLTAAETWAPVIQIFRDIFIVFMIVEIILVIGAVAILVIQIARFVLMLKTEVKPIIDNARDTTKATKTTAEFVKRNVTDPFVKISAFLSGLSAFISEIIKIRRVFKNDTAAEEDSDA